MAGLIQLINQYMLTEFVPFMSKEHNLEEEDVAATWMRFIRKENPEIQIKPSTPKKKAAVPLPNEKPSEKMTLATLKEICRSKGIKVTGTKKQLLTRIEEHDAADLSLEKFEGKNALDSDVETVIENELVKEEDEEPAKEEEEPVKKKASKKKASKKDEDDVKKKASKKVSSKKNDKPDVIKTMEKKKEEIVISTDKFGNIVHEETGIAFSHDEEEIDGVKCRCAIGYRLDSGHLEELDAEKMALCDQYGFRYRVPDNFDEM